MKTLYAFVDCVTHTTSQNVTGYTLSEEGDLVGHHVSSSKSWLKSDLGVTSNSNHDLYNDLFGWGNWEVVWVEPFEMTSNTGFIKAINKYREKLPAGDKPIVTARRLVWYPHTKTAQVIDRFYMHMNEVMMLLRTNDLNCIMDAKALMDKYLTDFAASPDFPVSPCGCRYVQHLDNELVTAHLGTVQSFDTPEKALNTLVGWNVQVATDPAVNGGYRLVKTQPVAQVQFDDGPFNAIWNLNWTTPISEVGECTLYKVTEHDDQTKP